VKSDRHLAPCNERRVTVNVTRELNCQSHQRINTVISTRWVWSMHTCHNGSNGGRVSWLMALDVSSLHGESILAVPSNPEADGHGREADIDIWHCTLPCRVRTQTGERNGRVNQQQINQIRSRITCWADRRKRADVENTTHFWLWIFSSAKRHLLPVLDRGFPGQTLPIVTISTSLK
jgi:hypothetical protein